ncbi:hypothetical protein AJ80_04560 [Polytolypa hystricis UAMH7299]|uniref:Uncharacterized protein n=1 Tax=Polytolypa hystricis (strain UAMH7299) TaxID=1447883 RepID=A0A2B7YAW0_POLH7|nr:hypothetical protein AJ80_04560 [Polytolypa hystricis UAMH7299]
MSASIFGNGPRSSRDHRSFERPSLATRFSGIVQSTARYGVASIRARGASTWVAYSREYSRARRRHRRVGWLIALLRMVLSLQNVLLLVWGLTLWWGERVVFRDSVQECSWELWENWPQEAIPHHVAFIADPQLVDPHTYPGRLWPLSSLTIFYADLYLYRTHSLLQQNLRPDTTFFLGDLFDGGREWATDKSSSPEERFKHYGNSMWMQEYRRFSRIFFDTWRLGGANSASSTRGRKIIASLPGNHDLGFGHGIQRPVVERFQKYFGEGNRVDVLGNHSVISVDTVSLSAVDQPDPQTGSSSGSDGSSQGDEVWRPAQNFLNDLQVLKARVTREELLALQGKREAYLAPHKVVDAEVPLDLNISPLPAGVDLPTIVLTHVPLYRDAGTPCGPLRERYPPSSTDPLREKDERNAIKIHRGYQYQNVLTEAISKDIVTKAGPGVTQIYSGDDHDYCEVTHRKFSGSPKEITVKTMSLAMGVRRPGFQMASLWNPIDPDSGKPTSTKASPTIQNFRCLLPDQIAIFLRYAYLFVFTLLILFVRAISRVFYPSEQSPSTPDPLLPLSHRFNDESQSSSASTATSSPSHSEHRFASRGLTGVASRASSSSPSGEMGMRPTKHVQIIGVPGVNGSNDDSRRAEWDICEKSKDKPWASTKNNIANDFQRHIPRGPLATFCYEFMSSFKWVGSITLVWYLRLIWTW